MSQSPFRRWWAALVLAAAFLPLAAPARALERSIRAWWDQPPLAVPRLLAPLWDTLVHLWSKEGSGLDPNGGAATVEEGGGLDPDGRTHAADAGSGLDPDGSR